MELAGFEEAYELYIVPHNKFTSSLEQDTRDLIRLVSTPHTGESSEELAADHQALEDIEKINDDIERYEADFAHLISLIERRGTTMTGLEGSFRARALLIEEEIRKHSHNEKLQISMLKLRLAEEEYLLHRTPDRAEQVNFWYHELGGEVDDALDIARKEKSIIETELDTYNKEFEELVVIDREIEELEAEIKVLVADIERLAIAIDDLGRYEADLEIEDARRTTTETIQLVAVSLAVVFIFGVGLTLTVFYRHRTKPEVDIEQNKK